VPQQRVYVHHEFAAPVERVYAHLAEHENLQKLFGLKVERVRDGDTDRNGAGSVRRLSFKGVAPFEETITKAVPNELIEYRITKGGPLRDHAGRMRFTANGTGSTLDYEITFGAKVPGVAPLLKVFLDRGIRRGLRGVDQVA
jgi:uncharacterized protein YndB with AHSA1/START domain